MWLYMKGGHSHYDLIHWYEILAITVPVNPKAGILQHRLKLIVLY